MLSDRRVKIQPPELGSWQVGQESDFFSSYIVIEMHLFVVLSIFVPVDFFFYCFKYGNAVKSDSLFCIPEPHGLADTRGFFKAE